MCCLCWAWERPKSSNSAGLRSSRPANHSRIDGVRVQLKENQKRRRWTCLRSKQDRQSPIPHKRMTGPYLKHGGSGKAGSSGASSWYHAGNEIMINKWNKCIFTKLQFLYQFAKCTRHPPWLWWWCHIRTYKEHSHGQGTTTMPVVDSGGVASVSANETRSEIGFCLQIGTLLSATRFFGVLAQHRILSSWSM